jgi:hypothetical protein
MLDMLRVLRIHVRLSSLKQMKCDVGFLRPPILSTAEHIRQEVKRTVRYGGLWVSPEVLTSNVPAKMSRQVPYPSCDSRSTKSRSLFRLDLNIRV